MADSSQEKTEQPTSKRLDEARASGQIAYSRELTAALLLLGGLMTLQFSGADLMRAMLAATRAFLALPQASLDVHDPTPFLAALGHEIGSWLLPIFAVAAVAIIAPGLAQTRFALSTKKLEPKFEKLSPIRGLSRLFSLDSIANVSTSALKMALVGVLAWFTIDEALPELALLGSSTLPEIVGAIVDLVFLLGFRVGAALLAISLLDVLYRNWKTNRDLMMTKEEVKEERKQSEGDPRIKGKIREVQRALVLQRMKSDLKTADVVVRNPTHFAVALRYDRENDASPRVVAKGRALMALTIIRLAEEWGIEVIENRPLARELYRSVRLGDVIPERLFRAVAEILAHVYRKKKRRSGVAREGAAREGSRAR